MFFDDLQILRTIDRLETAEQTGSLTSGTYLLQEVTGGAPVTDDRDYRSFIRELELAQQFGFLEFGLMLHIGELQPTPDRIGANNYLDRLRDFGLTPIGRDRARRRVFEREPPEPGEDDGSPFSRLTLVRIASIIAAHYAPARLALFLEDAGIPREIMPQLDNPESGLLDLFSLLDGSSADRRTLREFLGRWLSQDLHSGPDEDDEKELLADLARQGWYVREGRLVRGEPLRRATVAPLIGGDLLANLHPQVADAARPFFGVGNRAAAVFEAFKAIELRVRGLLGSAQSGMSLMSSAFDGDPPALCLNEGADPSDIDERRGFAMIFKGSMQGIRNPKAHAPFEELDERRALDYLGLASLLMRRLDDVEARTESQSA